jgi:sulfate adenylyltransferase
MDLADCVPAHGGQLRDLVVDTQRAALLKKIAHDLPDITLSDHHLCDFELMATGAFSPLEGFMVQADYESVLDRLRLQDGTLWPIPICLDISENKARSLEAGQSVALRDPEGFLLGLMHIADIWQIDKDKEAQAIFNTVDISHPGVQHLYHKTKEFYIGGTIEVISLPLHYDYRQLRRTPAEIRREYQKMGWQRVVAYETHGIIHRAKFETTLEAMRQAKANLLLLAIVGITRTEDFDYYTRVRCNKDVVRHYPPDTLILSLLPHFMRLAGPKEAVLNAIVAKNYGCSHMVVSHDHADPGKDKGCACFYDNQLAKDIFGHCREDLGIVMLSFEEMIYLPFEDEHRFIDQVPPGDKTIRMTGKDIKERVRTGRKVPGWASFPEVLDELRKTYPPPGRQGFTLFLTGLSGAGKSTIAKVLYSKMLEIGKRPVTLLDGDIVRHNLSSELTFSKEHRDINVRRIGFVACEITKNRGIECEKRDRKGMYAKARAGLIKGYTGIDDPYEAPVAPELRINTTNITPDEAAQEVLLYLGQRGYI